MLLRRPTGRLRGTPPRSGTTQRILVDDVGGSTTLLIRGPGEIRVKIVGNHVNLSFGTSAVALVFRQTGSGSDVGSELTNGKSEQYLLTNETVVSWVCRLGTGYLLISRADNGKVGS